MSQSLPDFFSQIDHVNERIAGKTVLLFLDYDGTLTPIVATPDQAIISADMRQAVIQASERHKTAIVSGRATADVRDKVQIDNIYYAGSHGFEIVDPDGNTHENPQALSIRETVKNIYALLKERTAEIEGALVEDVKYTISVHYRLVAEKDVPRIEEIVSSVLKEFSDFRRTSGKKVFEVRPRIDWDKGKAVQWILKALNFDPQKNIAIYIGDDTTDEDAFSVLKDIGFGILVADHPKLSKAEYQVKDPSDVKKVLEYFVT